MKKKALLIVGLALMIATAGVVYAHWQDTLQVNVNVKTGTIDPQWSLQGTNDDGVNDGWDGEQVLSTVYTHGVATSNDPSGPYAPGVVTRYTTMGFNFSDTGWAGWSCPAGSTIVNGSNGEGHPMQVSQPAKAGVGTYPNYPHYNYTPPEEGWVWQSAQDGISTTGLVLWIECLSSGSGPRYEKDVADCTAELGTLGGEANDLLTVTLDNAYPSYWCTVKGDLHNLGSVPVRLQSITTSGNFGSVIEVQWNGLVGCGFQLEPGETVDFFGSFHPLNPVAQNGTYSASYVFTWVNYNEYDPGACNGL